MNIPMTFVAGSGHKAAQKSGLSSALASTMKSAFGADAVTDMRDDRVNTVNGYGIEGWESPWDDLAGHLGPGWSEGKSTAQGRVLTLGPNDEGVSQTMIVNKKDRSLTLVSNAGTTQGQPAGVTVAETLTLKNGKITHAVAR